MSRSGWASAETRWRCASVHGARTRRRFEGRLLLERRFSPGAVSATKYTLILLAAGVLLMAAEPARALAASVKETRASTQAHPADPVVALARGSGYGGGTDATRVRSLQRRLDSAGLHAGADRRTIRSEDPGRGGAVPARGWSARRRHRRAGHALGPAHAVVRGVSWSRLRRRRLQAGARTAAAAAPRRFQSGTDRWSLRTTDRARSKPLSVGARPESGRDRRKPHVRRAAAHRGSAATHAASTLDGPVESPTDASPEAVASGHATTQSAREDRSEFPRPDEPVGWDLMASRACSARAGLPRGAHVRRVADPASSTGVEGCRSRAFWRGYRCRRNGRARKRLSRTGVWGGSGACSRPCRSAGRSSTRVQPRRVTRASRRPRGGRGGVPPGGCLGQCRRRLQPGWIAAGAGRLGGGNRRLSPRRREGGCGGCGDPRAGVLRAGRGGRGARCLQPSRRAR